MRTTLTVAAVLLLAVVLLNRPAVQAQQPAVGQRWEFGRLTYSEAGGGKPFVYLWTSTDRIDGGKLFAAAQLPAPGANVDYLVAALNAVNVAGWEPVDSWVEPQTERGRTILLRRVK